MKGQCKIAGEMSLSILARGAWFNAGVLDKSRVLLMGFGCAAYCLDFFRSSWILPMLRIQGVMPVSFVMSCAACSAWARVA